MSTITFQVICTVCGEKYNYDNGHKCKNGYAEPGLFSLAEANAMAIRQLKAEIKKLTTFTPEPGALADLKAQAEKSPSSRAAKQAYINALEWELKAQREWIAVEDRLPVACIKRMYFSEDIIAFNGYSEFIAAYDTHQKKWWAEVYNGFELPNPVTHWMPLPAAPESEVR